jgi:hypothetical protein
MRIYNEILLILISVFCLQFTSSNSSSGCKKNNEVLSVDSDSIVLKKLKHVDKQRFIGLVVDSFLSEETIANYKSFRFMEEPPRLLVYYAKNLWIDIYVSDFIYIKNPNDPLRWNFSEFKKEKIARINLVYYDKVIEKNESVSEKRETIFFPGVDSVRKKN